MSDKIVSECIVAVLYHRTYFSQHTDDLFDWYSSEEESVWKDTAHDLIIVIANRGYIEFVMDAAKGAGAYGGAAAD